MYSSKCTPSQKTRKGFNVDADARARCLGGGLAPTCMDMEEDSPQNYLPTILRRWRSWLPNGPGRLARVEGGLSGACIWKVTGEKGSFCLRRWPQEHPCEASLHRIHALQNYLYESGLRFVSRPLRSETGETFSRAQGHLWELTTWLPGRCSFLEEPTWRKKVSAIESLARVHAAASHVSGFSQSQAVPPGLKTRLQYLHALQSEELANLSRATANADGSPYQNLADRLIAHMHREVPKALRWLEPMETIVLPLTWCLRDIHQGNLLFSGEQLSGLVDFGAVAVDSPAGDLARLVGSFVLSNADEWRACVDAYLRIRRLSPAEIRAIGVYDFTGTVCSAANWVRWLIVERRSIGASTEVVRRLTVIDDRLTRQVFCPFAS